MVTIKSQFTVGSSNSASPDIPAGTITNTEVSASAAIALTKLAAETQGEVLIATTSGAIAGSGVGTDGQVLTSQGAGADAQFENVSAVDLITPLSTTKTVITEFQGSGQTNDLPADYLFTDNPEGEAGTNASSVSYSGVTALTTLLTGSNDNSNGAVVQRSKWILVSKNPTIEIKCSIDNATSGAQHSATGAWNGTGSYGTSSDEITFHFDTVANANIIRSTKNTSSTETPSTTAVDASTHVYTIVVTGGNSVEFFVDDVSIGSNSTNLPDVSMGMGFHCRGLDATTNSIIFEYAGCKQTR